MVLVLAACPALADSPQKPLLVGMAKIDITPDVVNSKVTMAGYFDRDKKPATSVHDPLFARSLVIEHAKGQRIAIVSVELTYVHDEIRDRVVKRLAAYGFNEHNILIAATHNHSGFGGFDTRFISTKLFGPFNVHIQDLLVDGIVISVTQALQNLAPGKINMAQTQLAGMSRSRRDPAFEVETGGAPAQGIAFDPEKYRTDRTLTVVQFQTLQGQTLGMIYNFASHPTILSPSNFAISGEWPGRTSTQIEKTLGQGTVALFLNGSLGDAAPTPDWSTLEQEWKDLVTYSDKMTDAVLALNKTVTPLDASTIKTQVQRRDFDRLRLRALGGIRLPKNATKLATIRIDQPTQAMRIGNLILLAVPAEATTAVGDKIKSLCSKEETCLIVGPANGHIGYLVLQDEWDEGAYAADTCLFGVEGSLKVIDGISKALQNVR
jgi:hypothetical protein